MLIAYVLNCLIGNTCLSIDDKLPTAQWHGGCLVNRWFKLENMGKNTKMFN